MENSGLGSQELDGRAALDALKARLRKQRTTPAAPSSGATAVPSVPTASTQPALAPHEISECSSLLGRVACAAGLSREQDSLSLPALCTLLAGNAEAGGIIEILEQQNRQISQLQGQVARLSTQASVSADESSASTKAIATVEAERDKALGDLERLKNWLVEKDEAEVARLEDDDRTLAQLAEERDNALRTVQQVTAERDAILSEREKVTHSTEAISTALREREIEVENLQLALGALSAETDMSQTWREEVRRLSDSNSSLQKSVEAAKAENSALAERLKEEETKSASLFAQSQAAATTAEELRRRCSKAEAAVRVAQETAETLKAEVAVGVDKRVVAQLMSTYFEQGERADVLDLISAVLDLNDVEKGRLRKLHEENRKRSGLRRVARVASAPLRLPLWVAKGIASSIAGSGDAPPVSNATKAGGSLTDMWINYLTSGIENSSLRENGEHSNGQENARGRDHSDSEHHDNQTMETVDLSSPLRPSIDRLV